MPSPEYRNTEDVYNAIQWCTEFKVTAAHVELLRNAYVSWNTMEFGAPTIDPKRPYGSSVVASSIAEIVQPRYKDMDDDQQEDFTEKRYDKLVKIHAETAIVLQIVLQTGKLRTGRYRRPDPYGGIWSRVKDGTG